MFSGTNCCIHAIQRALDQSIKLEFRSADIIICRVAQTGHNRWPIKGCPILPKSKVLATVGKIRDQFSSLGGWLRSSLQEPHPRTSSIVDGGISIIRIGFYMRVEASPCRNRQSRDDMGELEMEYPIRAEPPQILERYFA